MKSDGFGIIVRLRLVSHDSPAASIERVSEFPISRIIRREGEGAGDHLHGSFLPCERVEDDEWNGERECGIREKMRDEVPLPRGDD